MLEDFIDCPLDYSVLRTWRLNDQIHLGILHTLRIRRNRHPLPLLHSPHLHPSLLRLSF